MARVGFSLGGAAEQAGVGAVVGRVGCTVGVNGGIVLCWSGGEGG